MMEINRLIGELTNAGRAADAIKSSNARKTQKASGGTESSLLNLRVQFPDAEAQQASRADKVERLKAAIASGTYNPDPVLVARKILGVE